MRAVIVFALASAALTGCTVGENCRDQVESTRETALGFVAAGRCGVGHCLTFTRPTDVVRLHLPAAPGTFSLEELDAELCPHDGESDCVPIRGAIVAREVHRPEQGRAVGRLDADLRIEDASLPTEVRLDYREELVERCTDETWPKLGRLGMFGPS